MISVRDGGYGGLDRIYSSQSALANTVLVLDSADMEVPGMGFGSANLKPIY
jgi:hypothetical protein